MKTQRMIRYEAVLVAAALFSAGGCSSSVSYVDYTAIPAATTDAANSLLRAEESAVTAVRASEVEQPLAANGDPVHGETDQQLQLVEKMPEVVPVASSGSESSVAADTTSQAAVAGSEAGIANERYFSPADSTGERLTEYDQASGDRDHDGQPRAIRLLVPEKQFRSEGEIGALRVTYDDIDLLKTLNMEPVPADAVDHFPQWLQDLDGQRIRLRGFMFPTFVASGLTSFGLARDNGICCFVKQPKVYDLIDVSLIEGATTDYIENKPFDVEGIFRIVPNADDIELFQLYRIEKAVVLR